MDFFDKFKRFLGLPGRQDSPNFNDQDRDWPEPPRSDGRSFNVFTDPLEMHRYFEQQMSEVLRSFGFSEFGDGFNHHFSFSETDDFTEFGTPQIEEAPGDLREQFLKPGYENAVSDKQDDKKDKDIDGKLDIRDWGSVFKGESATPAPKIRFFGQSVTSKTVRNPDGSVETHHTVRDNEGNEETTIKRKIGDKEYSITKRRDKEGKEETIENLVNLDEKDVDKFFSKQPELGDRPWPLFDRFFK